MSDRGPLESPALELASRQAALAFERTLLGLDQLLMSSIRTSLSLLTFGFAMFLFFQQVSGEAGVNLRVPARNFGISLVVLGVGLLSGGLVAHRRRYATLRRQMEDLHQRQLLAEGGPRTPSRIAIIGVLLLLAGLLAIVGIVIRMGPFG